MNYISQIIYPLLTVFWWVPLLILIPIPRGELGPGAGPAGVEFPEIQGNLKTQEFELENLP